REALDCIHQILTRAGELITLRRAERTNFVQIRARREEYLQTVGLGGYTAAAYYGPAGRSRPSRRTESIANCSAGFARITRHSVARLRRRELQGLGPARAGVADATTWASSGRHL